MKRKYTTAFFTEKVAEVKSFMPDAFIGVDVMVGARGETEEFFRKAHQFMTSIDVSQYHVFSYSERAGTKALEIPHVVSPQEKHWRSAQILELSNQKLHQFYERFLGTVRPVLLEHSKDGQMMHGFTDNYLRVSVKAHDMDNEMLNVRLMGWDANGETLEGEIV